MRSFSNMRRVNDWIRVLTLISTLGAIAGAGWAICAYPIQWSDNSKRLNKLEPIVLDAESRISMLEKEHVQMQGDMKVIVARLTDIKENTDFLRRDAARR